MQVHKKSTFHQNTLSDSSLARQHSLPQLLGNQQILQLMDPARGGPVPERKSGVVVFHDGIYYLKDSKTEAEYPVRHQSQMCQDLAGTVLSFRVDKLNNAYGYDVSDFYRILRAHLAESLEASEASEEAHYLSARIHAIDLMLDEDKNTFFQNVRDDAIFTGSKDSRGNVCEKNHDKQMALSLNTVKFFDMTDTSLPSSLPITLYRTVNLDYFDPSSAFLESLPFSTTTSLDFAKGWIDPERPCRIIFKMEVPLNSRLFMMSYPSSTPALLQSPRALNQAQGEVVLGPARLTDFSLDADDTESDDYSVFDCRVEPFTRSDYADQMGQFGLVSI